MTDRTGSVSGAEAAEADAAAALAERAARVQDLLGDLELALLRGDDPFTVLASVKAAWREFRDAALGRPVKPAPASRQTARDGHGPAR